MFVQFVRRLNSSFLFPLILLFTQSRVSNAWMYDKRRWSYNWSERLCESLLLLKQRRLASRKTRLLYSHNSRDDWIYLILSFPQPTAEMQMRSDSSESISLLTSTQERNWCVIESSFLWRFYPAKISVLARTHGDISQIFVALFRSLLVTHEC